MLSITTAIDEDLSTLAQIEQICFPVKESASLSTIKSRFAVFPNQFLVAKIHKDEDTEIVGFINGMITDSLTINDEMYVNAKIHQPNGKYQTIFGLDVLPSYQHLGIATKLMNKFIEKAKNEQRLGVILTCKYQLIPFYKQFGFENLGISQSTHGGAIWYDMLFKI